MNEQLAMSLPSLAGRRLLVTGAGTGIGRATALTLGRNGAFVGVHYRSSESGAHETAALIAQSGGQAVALRADLLQEAECASLIASFQDSCGGIDGLINNAGGISDYKAFTELERSAWDEAVGLNATAPWLLVRAAWPSMAAQGFGRIVNVSTAAVRYGSSPKSVHYVAAKAALEAMTVSLAKEGAKCGILVNAVRCGLIETDMRFGIDGYTEEQYRVRASQVPLGRAGRAEEPAALIAYLASDAGSFITGQVMTVAGGD